MELDIQLFGGRGAVSTGKRTKTYTAKDIKPIREHFSKYPVGYELNGFYLLKDYYGLRTTEQYNWIINKTGKTYQWYGEKNKAIESGEAINVKNFKEGKEKLLELANKKKSTKKTKKK